MRLLITGAAGVLASRVAELARKDGGYTIRLTDMLPVRAKHEFIQADLADLEQARRVCRDIDVIVHCAAIHPWKKYTADQYLDCNIKGTHHLLQGAVDAGVTKLVYTSSIAAMGYAPVPPAEPPLTEAHCPNAPVENLYGVSKLVGEHFCEMFRRSHKLNYIVIRPPAFMPKDMDDPMVAVGLLSTYMVADDVAAGHYDALKADVPGGEAFILAADNPFQPSDAEELRNDAVPVVLRYFPEAEPLLRNTPPRSVKVRSFYSNAKAKEMLGFRPKHSFRQWLARHLARTR